MRKEVKIETPIDQIRMEVGFPTTQYSSDFFLSKLISAPLTRVRFSTFLLTCCQTIQLFPKLLIFFWLCASQCFCQHVYNHFLTLAQCKFNSFHFHLLSNVIKLCTSMKLFNIEMVDCSSSKISAGPKWASLKLYRRRCIHTASYAALTKTIYSASAVDNATQVCFLLFQLTTRVRLKRYLEICLLSTRSTA